MLIWPCGGRSSIGHWAESKCNNIEINTNKTNIGPSYYVSNESWVKQFDQVEVAEGVFKYVIRKPGAKLYLFLDNKPLKRGSIQNS